MVHSKIVPGRENGLTGLRGGFGHHAGYFAEDEADTDGDSGHDRPCGDGYKSRHQGVFDQVLAGVVCPQIETGLKAFVL